MWFTRVSIANPVFATMMMAALLVLGLSTVLLDLAGAGSITESRKSLVSVEVNQGERGRGEHAEERCAVPHYENHHYSHDDCQGLTRERDDSPDAYARGWVTRAPQHTRRCDREEDICRGGGDAEELITNPRAQSDQ